MLCYSIICCFNLFETLNPMKSEASDKVLAKYVQDAFLTRKNVNEINEFALFV